jgi:putative AdoMet-dependent methyltransferase
MHGMLKPSGQVYIHDVILEQDGALENIEAFIQRQSVAGGDFLKNDAEAIFSKNIQPMTGSWMGSLLAQDSR